MNQQDYLERQIEMMSKALMGILAKVIGMENIYLPFFITQEFSPEEKELLDVDNWPPKSKKEAEEYLKDPKWNPALSEQMIELLLVIAEKSSDEEQKRILESAQHLLDALNETTDVLSFNRLSIQERVTALQNI